MAEQVPPVLAERIAHRNTFQRMGDLFILCLLLSLLLCRLHYLSLSLSRHAIPCLLAFLCESCFAFLWFLTLTVKWSPAQYRTHPQRMSDELPGVDMFVTTADPELEPPILTLNTVLSLMAVDYPPHKLACYVSDDAASPLTFYALLQALPFATLWVPFCKRYRIQIRAPFRYFTADSPHPPTSTAGPHSPDFQRHSTMMKVEYEKLVQKIAQASQTHDLNLKDHQEFSNIDSRNHGSIIKVIWENKDDHLNGLPHLVYISREKRPKHPHKYKAGAMNVLTRVSGLMTNAPFLLNVDCDMYVNNPQVVMHAMCVLVGFTQTKNAFVQFPQDFYNGPSESMKVLMEYMGKGFGGLQGPLYQGTGCFHRRKIIYGCGGNGINGFGTCLVNESLLLEKLRNKFGESMELCKSVGRILFRTNDIPSHPVSFSSLVSLVDAASKVAGCEYENGTCWGEEVGWMYGSSTEDILTGFKIHSMGWKSALCIPDPPAFLGCMPLDASTALRQQKRWAAGLLQIFIRHNPLLATLRGRLQFRQCLAYLWISIWALRSIPELCYTALPAYCIITKSYFLPKGLTMCIPLGLFLFYNIHTLSEYLRTGGTLHGWWAAQKMARINSATAWLSALFSVIANGLGVSEPTFDITDKNPASSDGSSGFLFTESPMFVLPTAVSLVHLSALCTMLVGLQLPGHGGGGGSGIGEIGCSLFVVLCFWPFVEGLFKRGRGGLPAPTVYKAVALALLFVQFCRWTAME